MKMSKFRIAVLVLLVATVFTFVISPVKAEYYQDVQCLVAYDEEFAITAGTVYWYSPEVLARILVGQASYRFKISLNIRFLVAGCVTWDSDDSYNIYQMIDEAIDETGFYRGMPYGGYEIEVLIALTDQNIGGDDYGVCWTDHYAIIARETLLGWPSHIQSTDNIIQHELSHFYGCDDHYIWASTHPCFDCVMNTYRSEFIFPEGWVRRALVTEKWCSECTELISQNREILGYQQQVGGGGCPTLFVWNGNDYVDYGVIDIHNSEGIDVVREVPVQMEDVGLNNHKATFRLREGWEGLKYSESFIDQVKLYAYGEDGKRHLCPLINATHSTLGNVMPQLLLSDDVKAQTLLLETTDLTFIVPCQNVQSFTFVIEGHNAYKLPD